MPTGRKKEKRKGGGGEVFRGEGKREKLLPEK